jgi:hypothetical protein
VQCPATQSGSAAGHCALALHVDPVGAGWHPPFTHVKPEAHAVALQSGTQAPSSQTSPGAHWLEYSQAFDAAVQIPSAQT